MTIRVPISVASRKGISGLVDAAERDSVLLTSHGRAVARVDGPERVEEIARQVREATLAVLDAAAELVAGRAGRLSLDEVCERVGLDAASIRAVAAERARRGA